MSPELYMERARQRLAEIAGEMRRLLDDWDQLPDRDRRVKLYDIYQSVQNQRALAENWEMLAEDNGVLLPEERDDGAA